MKHIKLFENFKTNEGILVDVARGLENAGKLVLDVLTTNVDYENFKKFFATLVADLKSKKEWSADKATPMELAQSKCLGGYLFHEPSGEERQLFLGKEGAKYLITYDDPMHGMIASIVLNHEDAEHVFKLLGDAIEKHWNNK
jgi:hypothetical protein